MKKAKKVEEPVLTKQDPTRQKLISRYIALCQELGDLIIKAEKSAERMDRIKEEISVIDSLGAHPSFRADEKESK